VSGGVRQRVVALDHGLAVQVLLTHACIRRINAQPIRNTELEIDKRHLDADGMTAVIYFDRLPDHSPWAQPPDQPPFSVLKDRRHRRFCHPGSRPRTPRRQRPPSIRLIPNARANIRLFSSKQKRWSIGRFDGGGVSLRALFGRRPLTVWMTISLCNLAPLRRGSFFMLRREAALFF
jgi:hypothetical protein